MMIGQIDLVMRAGHLRTSFHYLRKYAFYLPPVTLHNASKQVETYQAEPDSDTHGTSGPIKVSIAQDQVNIAEEFLAVAAAYDPERGQTKDLYDFHTANKYGVKLSAGCLISQF